MTEPERECAACVSVASLSGQGGGPVVVRREHTTCYRRFLEAIPHGVGILDAVGGLAYANRSLANYFGSERIRRPFSLEAGRVHAEDALAVNALQSALDAGQRSVTQDLRLRRIDGAYRWHTVQIEALTPQLDASHWLVTCTDVEEQIDAQLAMAQMGEEWAIAADAAAGALHAKSTFLALLQHELRTPLTGVMGLATLMLGTELTGQQREYMRLLNDSGQMLHSTMTRLLNAWQDESSDIALELAPVNVREFVAGTLAMLEPAAGENGIALRWTVSDDVAFWVAADSARLRQVLLSLIGHAIEVSLCGSEVWLKLRCSGSAVESRIHFEVTDARPPGAPDRWQSPFGGHVARAQREVGLELAERLVRAMGGTIGALTTPECGKSFFFSLVLPLASPAREALAPPPVTCARRILVVDDNDINRMIVQRLLEGDGHIVTAVADGSDAVDAVQAQLFDLVLMDVQMPVMGGLEATALIRALPDERLASIPIIALTANGMAEDLDNCRAAGMDDYLGKPVDRAQLRAVLVAHIQTAAGVLR